MGTATVLDLIVNYCKWRIRFPALIFQPHFILDVHPLYFRGIAIKFITQLTLHLVHCDNGKFVFRTYILTYTVQTVRQNLHIRLHFCQTACTSILSPNERILFFQQTISEQNFQPQTSLDFYFDLCQHIAIQCIEDIERLRQEKKPTSEFTFVFCC